MTVLHRRLFMLFFIFLFLIIGPMIVLHAKGYRFDLKKGIFVYSGSISIKGFPRNFQVFIDGKQTDKGMLNVINNSYTINSIRPGEYNLKCQRPGYTAWEKNIKVHSGISTEFWNVLLFPKENKDIKKYTDLSVEQFFLSPREEEEIVFFNEKSGVRNVYLLDTGKSEVKKIFSTEKYGFLPPSYEENIEWSTNNKMILIPFKKENGQKKYLVARIRGENIKEIADVNELFSQFLKNSKEKEEGEDENKKVKKYPGDQNEKKETEIEKIRWMFDKKDELVILTKNKELYYFYLNEPEKSLLLEKDVTAFDFAGNRVYYTKAPHNLLWEIKDNKIETKRQISSKTLMENNEDFVKLIVYDEYRFAVINNQGQLLVFNEEKEKGEKFEEIVHKGIRDIQFSNDGKKLLYWSNNEVWFMMLRDWDVQPIRKKGEKFLITRFSKKINNIQWMDNYENIIFSADNQIKSSEIDVRDHPNITNIHETRSLLKPREVFYSKENQTLYFKDENTLKSFILIEKTGILPI